MKLLIRLFVFQVCPKSLENVIVRFLEKSESRTEEARLQSQQIAERRVEDLDQMDQPEKLVKLLFFKYLKNKFLTLVLWYIF